MTGKNLLFAVPLLLSVGLGACASNGVQPGIVNRSAPQQSYPANQGNGQNYGTASQSYVPSSGYQNASMANGQGNGPVSGTTPLDPNDPANANAGPQNGGPQYGGPQTASASPNSGRVVSINDVSLAGSGGGSGGGVGSGTLIGGLLGGAGGAAIGAASGRGLGGGIVGGLLGAVGGAIAGTLFDQRSGTGGGGGGRGIEVTVQKDDGQNVTVAQRDVGDIQLGDRVQIVQGRNGVAQVVRDTQRNPD